MGLLGPLRGPKAPEFLERGGGSLQAITQKGRRGKPGRGGLGLLAPAWAAQHAKVPRTRGWLFRAITPKDHKGEPGGWAIPHWAWPSNLGRAIRTGAGWACWPCLGCATCQSSSNEVVALWSHHTNVVQG